MAEFGNPGRPKGKKTGLSQVRGYGAWLTDDPQSHRRLTAASLSAAAQRYVERFIEKCDFGTELSVTVFDVHDPNTCYVYLVEVRALPAQVGRYTLPPLGGTD